MRAIVLAASDVVPALLREVGVDEVTLVHTGTEMIRALRAIAHDLVVIDVDMPVVEGTVLCRVVTRVAPGASVITTGECDEAVVQELLDAGAHDHLTKPIRPLEARARIRGALRLRTERAQQQRREENLRSLAQRLEQSCRELEGVASVDALTGLANRRHFDQLLDAEWHRAMRKRSALSLVFVDLDDFHRFNERYGHVGGDECLRRVAEALAGTLRRASDVVARYGGEEFVAILPDTDAAGACIIAERMRAAVESLAIPHEASRSSSVVTLSTGTATRYPDAKSSRAALVTAADTALFRAKREGRNRCRAEDDLAAKSASNPASAPRAFVDAAVATRIPLFLESRRNDMRCARSAAHVHDWGRIRSLSQNLVELASEIGLDELARLGTELNAAVRGNKPVDDVQHKAIITVIDRIASYLDRVQVTYRGRLRAG